MTEAKKDSIRDNIIMKGAELIHANGFNHTGLNEILQKADVPKGSFYFYFKNKDEFGCAVIDYLGAFIGGIFLRYLGDPAVKPMERFDNLFKFYIRYFQGNNYRLGCPIGNLSLELADLSSEARAHLKAAIDTLISPIESCLGEAVEEGSISSGIDPGETARFIFYGFEGAILHLKILKDISPLTAFRKVLFGYMGYAAPEIETVIKQ